MPPFLILVNWGLTARNSSGDSKQFVMSRNRQYVTSTNQGAADMRPNVVAAEKNTRNYRDTFSILKQRREGVGLSRHRKGEW